MQPSDQPKVVLSFKYSVTAKPQLTSREKVVAQAFLQVHNNKKVAKILGFSLGTVAFHAASIRQKMRGLGQS
ncbi:MAG: helix-turn-helix transcriptional regulator [Gammaproteobacteria bacterium]